MPNRSQKALLFSEKVKVLDLDGKGENWMLRFQKSSVKNKSSINEIVRKEKEICASFALSSKLQKFTNILDNECFIKTEKAFSCVQ